MKPQIFHLLDDQNVGGIVAAKHGLSTSRLAEQFDFHVIRSQDLKTVLTTEPVDLVIFHNPCSWQRSQFLAMTKIHRKKLLIHDHHYSAGFEQYRVPDATRFHAMMRLSYRFADHVVAVSQAQADWMQDNHFVSPTRLTMIQQCPSLQAYLKLPRKPIEGKLVLGAYGRFSRQKGFDVLLKAMRLLPADCPVHLNLGGYGEEEEVLRSLAEGLTNVTFWGKLSNAAAFLGTCDVVVIPSRWEPWGNVCVEAKAAAKPVIASRVDGLSEQIGDRGWLVSPDDPQRLADAIVDITTVPVAQLEQWGDQARGTVVDAWESYVKAWESVLWKVLRSGTKEGDDRSSIAVA